MKPSDLAPSPSQGWLNRNVIGMSLTSLFSDTSHEMATSILPLFIVFAVGGNPAIVGLVEGASDGASSLVKSYSGYYSDKSGKRTPIMYLGYLLTGILIPAIGFAVSWLQVLVLRVGAWTGRGARGPPRDALMVDSVPADSVGKAFGFERTFDTVGAVIGPAIALLLIPYLPYSQIFFVSFVPGVVCIAVVLGMVRDRPPGVKRTGRDRGGESISFLSSVRILPREFRLLLVSVGLFGIANFSNVIFTLRAEQVLQPSLGISAASQLAVLLYLLLNVIYALGSFPAGYLADRISKRNLLAVGYSVFAFACIASIFESPGYPILITIFVLAGLQTAIVDTVEKAFAAEMLGQSQRGTGYGVLQTVNGIGDFVSSVMIGVLWTVLTPGIGFATVASLALIATLVLLVVLRDTKPAINRAGGQASLYALSVES
ncbi:MAG: MFS transporter [Nitrososphaerales archaeon]|nr:MFS transporter [Nitrososphaerales archaeon]